MSKSLLEVMLAILAIIQERFGATAPVTCLSEVVLPGSERPLGALMQADPMQGLWLFHTEVPGTHQMKWYVLGIAPRSCTRHSWAWQLFIADYGQHALLQESNNPEEIARLLEHVPIKEIAGTFKAATEAAYAHHESGKQNAQYAAEQATHLELGCIR